MIRTLVALKRFLILGAIWLALTGGAPGGLVFGAITAAGAAWLSLRLLPPTGDGISLLVLARMFPGFVWRSVLGGIDVAMRALHPRMRLKTGWVVLPTTLPAGGARVALGGEFSLLPGTLVAGVREIPQEGEREGERNGELLIHCLDTDQEIESAIRREEDDIAAAMGVVLKRDGREGAP